MSSWKKRIFIYFQNTRTISCHMGLIKGHRTRPPYPENSEACNSHSLPEKEADSNMGGCYIHHNIILYDYSELGRVFLALYLFFNISLGYSSSQLSSRKSWQLNYCKFRLHSPDFLTLPWGQSVTSIAIPLRCKNSIVAERWNLTAL